MTNKEAVKYGLGAILISVVGLALSYAVGEWIIPKTSEGYFERPIDIFIIVFILGASNGISFGLWLHIGLELIWTKRQ